MGTSAALRRDCLYRYAVDKTGKNHPADFSRAG